MLQNISLNFILSSWCVLLAETPSFTRFHLGADAGAAKSSTELVMQPAQECRMVLRTTSAQHWPSLGMRSRNIKVLRFFTAGNFPS